MVRAIVFDTKDNPVLDESGIDFLTGIARDELRSGIKEKYLMEVYKRTYGASVAGRIFRLINH